MLQHTHHLTTDAICYFCLRQLQIFIQFFVLEISLSDQVLPLSPYLLKLFYFAKCLSTFQSMAQIIDLPVDRNPVRFGAMQTGTAIPRTPASLPQLTQSRSERQSHPSCRYLWLLLRQLSD
jgi:hypothetical protein